MLSWILFAASVLLIVFGIVNQASYFSIFTYLLGNPYPRRLQRFLGYVLAYTQSSDRWLESVSVLKVSVHKSISFHFHVNLQIVFQCTFAHKVHIYKCILGIKGHRKLVYTGPGPLDHLAQYCLHWLAASLQGFTQKTYLEMPDGTFCIRTQY